MPAPILRRAAAAVTAAALVLLPTGCTGGDDGGTGRPVTATLAHAKRRLDHTAGVHLELSTDRLPHGVSGILQATGLVTHAPAFKGTIKVASHGVTAVVPVVALHGVVHAQLPFTSGFQRIDPGDYNAPDPASLLDPDHGLSSLLTSVRHPTAAGRVREGSQVLDTYHGTEPGALVSGIIPSAQQHDFDVTFTLAPDDTLVSARLTGPFYAQGGPVTYTISFDRYGAQARIQAP